MQDGTQLQFKSVARNRYLAAEQGGGGAIVADREQPSGWETFKVSRWSPEMCVHGRCHTQQPVPQTKLSVSMQLWRIDETTFNFRVFGNQFVGVDGAGRVVATATTPGPSARNMAPSRLLFVILMIE